MAYDPEKRRAKYLRKISTPEGLEQHRASSRKAMKKVRDNNPDVFKQWRNENVEYDRQRCREYRENNLERARMATQRYRTTKRSQFIEDVDPEVLYQMHGGMCGICEEFIEGDFHIDHVIPISKGGIHGYVNTQPAHPFCNISKGNRV